METVTLIGRLLVSLAVVLGLMWVVARKMGKRAGGGRATRVVEVLGRQQLSRSASVAVVRVMDQALVVGITDGQVNLLGETELGKVQAAVANTAPAPRRERPAPRPTTVRLPAEVTATGTEDARPPTRGPLAGSALSPATWRQTVDALRDMTVRSK
jgi:flagellar protein FliO/FliZ